MVFKNDKAVSPVVATLVLVVVAIIGAAAVGALLGAFSSDVSDEASAGETSGASSTELLIGGSTTVQPVSEVLADAYMEEHKGIKVNVQGGGSGAGVSGAEKGVLDIGSSSSAIAKADHPDLQVFEIGGSAVVLIGSNEVTAIEVPGADAAAQQANMKAIYTAAVEGVAEYDDTLTASTGAALTVLQRSSASGTEETFSEYIGDGSKTFIDGTEALGKASNGDVYSAVKSASTPTIGFVDYGFYNSDDSTELHLIGLGCTQAEITPTNIKAALKVKSTGTGTADFPTGLCRNLYYCTLGSPSSTEQSFINFAMSPGAIDFFHEAGTFSNM